MSNSTKLPDLGEVIKSCKLKLNAIDVSAAVEISPSNAALLISAYREVNPKHSIELIGGHTLAIGTGSQLRHISIQETPSLAVLAENLRALEIYRKTLDAIAKEMGFSSRTGDGSNFFSHFPNEDWEAQVPLQDARNFKKSLSAILTEQTDQDRFLRFISDPDWSGMRRDDGKIGRKLDRSTDWQESAILKTGSLVAAASAGRVNLVRAIDHAGFGANLVSFLPTSSISPQSAVIGENVIFYGAPGTGKSNKVDKEVAVNGKKPFRTVFHPDLQNSDFFGCLKPQMNGKKVSYKFAPGPFMEALAAAYSKPNEPVYLVIEELNRAAAAAVFGDLFLLLDRDDDGAGEYDVSFPSPESRAWFKRKTGADGDRLRLPSNLFIYATMNSADQGVYPIDTAFRRRWRQEYLPLDYASGPDGNIGYTDASGVSHKLPWRKFVELLNNYLIDSKTFSIAEDRLLGQWFVKKKELNSSGIPEKVLIYLWDDLLRHEGRKLIFNTSKVKTYGALAKATIGNQRFLSDGFIAELDAVSKPEQETPLEVGDVSG